MVSSLTSNIIIEGIESLKKGKAVGPLIHSEMVLTHFKNKTRRHQTLGKRVWGKDLYYLGYSYSLFKEGSPV